MRWLVTNKLSWTWKTISESARANIRHYKTRAKNRQLNWWQSHMTAPSLERNKQKISSSSKSWESNKRPSKEKETPRLQKYKSFTHKFTQMESQSTISISSTWSCKESSSYWKRILSSSEPTNIHSKLRSRSRKKKLLLLSQKRTSLYRRAKTRSLSSVGNSTLFSK